MLLKPEEAWFWHFFFVNLPSWIFSQTEKATISLESQFTGILPTNQGRSIGAKKFPSTNMLARAKLTIGRSRDSFKKTFYHSYRVTKRESSKSWLSLNWRGFFQLGGKNRSGFFRGRKTNWVFFDPQNSPSKKWYKFFQKFCLLIPDLKILFLSKVWAEN